MITQDTKELLKFNVYGKTPAEIYQEACAAACRAVDLFYAQHGEPLYCGFGDVKIKNARYKDDTAPLDESCSCYCCKNF